MLEEWTALCLLARIIKWAYHPWTDKQSPIMLPNVLKVLIHVICSSFLPPVVDPNLPTTFDAPVHLRHGPKQIHSVQCG